MKKIIPSFQIQIFFIFITLLIFSVFFTRTYFLSSLDEYLVSTGGNKLEESLMKTYGDYKIYLPDSLQNKFGSDIVESIKIVKNNQLQKDFFQEEFDVYSYYIVIFLIIFALITFVISFALISRPLKRLQFANAELGRGKFDIRVKENPWSPLNELLVSFNKMATEIEENRKLLIEAEKRMIWREIAKSMAHEIKNPLTPIKLSIERLEMKYYEKVDNFDEIFDSTTKIICEEVNNLQELVNRFKGFSALPQPEPEYYDIKLQLSDIIKPYKNERKFSFSFEENLQMIFADKLQIKQVMTNLIQNAIQATKLEDKIDITLRNEENYIKIGIKDFGQGIDFDDLSKIFEPYFTTKRKGTGLGLAVVKQIIENHNGYLSVSSELGKGTFMEINLPINI